MPLASVHTATNIFKALVSNTSAAPVALFRIPNFANTEHWADFFDIDQLAQAACVIDPAYVQKLFV